ncbi:MAG: hypothetical protein DHS20C14_10150 [Phycisphaeraceae bacterium]|nr:MAG: hypothetical protein DHS20C14_10150 [Phycisphaeraceae bacterium]
MAAPHDRPLAGSFLTRHAMAITVGTLIVTSIMPAGWLAWAGWFRSLTETAVAPVSHPARVGARIFSPTARDADPEQLRLLYDELERERQMRLQAEARTLRVIAQLEQVSRGAAVNPAVPVVQVPAPVVGETAGLLLVRAGHTQGITRGTVVTAGGVQLLGTVEDADARTCRVRPITDRSVPTIGAAIMLAEDARFTLTCLLTPAGDGTLRGDAESPDVADPRTIEPGMTVRLQDDRWPEHAQMLLIGTIERVDPHPEMPLRRVITVRPSVDLLRVREAVFRVPDEDPRTRAEGSRP